MRQAYFSVWFPLILRLQKEKELNWKYVRAKCYQTRDSHSPRTYHCLQLLGALMQLLIEILCCQPAPLPPSPAICPLSNSLTVGWPLVEEVREWAQEWGCWNCPLFAENITSTRVSSKKGQTQALFSQYFWEGGKGDSFSDNFCEVSSFLNVFSAELPTYKRELLNCAKIISEKSPCGVPSDV